MPRIEADSTELSPEKGEPTSRLTFGASRVREPMSPKLFDWSVSAVIAVMAIGTFCTFCSRFCAVTVISSRVSSSAIAGAATSAVPSAAATQYLTALEPCLAVIFTETPSCLSVGFSVFPASPLALAMPVTYASRAREIRQSDEALTLHDCGHSLPWYAQMNARSVETG